jgi:hypothetical protein
VTLTAFDSAEVGRFWFFRCVGHRRGISSMIEAE